MIKVIPRVSCILGRSSYSFMKWTNSLQPFTSFKRQYPQLPKRFYADVTVSKNENDGAYEINLDNRKLKTPGRRVFQVKNKVLAHAIAQEWSSQDQFIQQSFMHLTSLANTVQDNPQRKTKFDLVNEILRHLPEDTIIYRVPDSDSKLLELQHQKWDPVVQWAETEFSTNIPIVHGTINVPEIPETSLAHLRNYLSSHSFEALHGLDFAAASVRSIILALAVSKQKLGVQEAVNLGRLETTFQTDHWGSIEWAHDLDLQETLSRTSAGILFYSMHCGDMTGT